MDEEIKSLNENNTWKLMILSKNKKLMKNHWIF